MSLTKEDMVRAVAQAGIDAMGRKAEEMDADPSILFSAVFTNALGTITVLREHGADVSAIKEIVGRLMLACEDNVAPVPRNKIN